MPAHAPEEWLPLRPDSFYADNGVDLRLNAEATGVDVRAREIALTDGGTVAYDALLLATGAEPVRLPLPGSDQPHVYTLRTLADCRAIIERAKTARRAVVLGASFIGLEVAASLRARGIEVACRRARQACRWSASWARSSATSSAQLHEEHGVVFHLEHECRLDRRPHA